MNTYKCECNVKFVVKVFFFGCSLLRRREQFGKVWTRKGMILIVLKCDVKVLILFQTNKY